MTIRRHCDPINVQAIWDGIRSAALAKQTADIAKISKHLQKTLECTVTQADLFIKQCVKDKLIVQQNRKSDASHQIYKIPKQVNPESDGKDWYCFECHLAGDVTTCANCFRVFHSGCMGSAKLKFELQKNANNHPNLSVNNDTTPRNISDSSICIVSDDEEPPKESTDNSRLEADSNDNIASSSNSSVGDKSRVPFDETLCSACNINVVDYNCNMEKEEMNYMLRFVLNRIRAWLPDTITHKMAEEEIPEWWTDTELTWRANQLFFEHMDMSAIDIKLSTETYTNFSEFLADVYTIQHNVAIFHGSDSQEFGAAEWVIRDTLHDMTEMRNCVDCYKYSNEKINPKWFCLPCRNPHGVVWAKQKGYPYWPAKVLKETATHFDVRFFGGKYERAFLERRLVKPITTPKQSLQIKSSVGFNKACEELKYYQTLLEKPGEVEKLKSIPKPTRKSLSKHKCSLNSSSTSTSALNPSNDVSTPALSEVNPVAAEESNSIALGKRKNNGSMEGSTEKKRKSIDEPQTSTPIISGNVIDISDGEEEPDHEYSFRQNTSQDTFIFDDTFEQVSSSTENFGKRSSPRRESGMQQLDQPYSDSVEKMRRKLEYLTNKNDIIKCAMDSMQTEIDTIMNANNEHLKRLFESHNQQISETKKKQWCYHCEQDAIYHCCWNTAYCSTTCQQQHWQSEHKKVCRRKR